MDSKPKIQLLKQKRSFLQYILLSVVTCSLYHYWFMDSLVKDVNVICKKDGQDTVGVGRMIGFSILTFGVYQYLWLAEIVDRVYDSADEYDVEIRQDSESFFIWMILVPFIGYFIAMHRFVSDVNQLAAEYEKRRHFVKCTSPITQRSLSSGRGTLIGLVGSLAGQTIELKPGQRIKIGRSAAEASVIVNSEKISRVHCLVQYNGNQLGYTVTDLSRNGVVVNGKRILYSVPTYVPSESVLSLADGANKFQQFKHIILPSIKTIITLNVILSITGSLSAFEQPYVITDGANGTGTYFVIMNEIAHVSQKVGLASAMAVVLLLIIFACTILQKLFFKYIFRDAESEDESYKAKRARLKAEKQAKKAGKGVA